MDERCTSTIPTRSSILYLFGIDHTKLTYRYSEQEFQLADVSGTVLHDLLA